MSSSRVSVEHEGIADRAARILEESGFTVVDREVDLEIGPDKDKFNLDVCALYKDALVVLEVKTDKNVDFKQEILAWSKKKEKLTDFNQVRVLGSRRQRTHASQLQSVRSCAIVILSTKDKPGPDYRRQAKVAAIQLWDLGILTYYGVTAKVLGSWTKFEIMYDLEVAPQETERPLRVPAIKAEQPGGTFYYCAMNPLDLLRIAYVYRRSKRDTLAYQRIVKQNKIESMTAFLSRKRASLPNNIIVALNPKISGELVYKNGMLTIPGKYCSAWIVDGQHRLYGFVRTKYCDEHTVGQFQLPVVLYDGLDARNQTAMFVDINNNQKKIDASLLADLSTALEDLSRKETWPSMLAKGLASSGPFKDLVEILEIPLEGQKRPISLAGLSKFVLTRTLLAPKFRKGKIIEYKGALYRYAPFNWRQSVHSRSNRQAFQKQLSLLNAYFSIVSSLMGRKWTNSETYGVTSYTGVNALLLVLNKILETGKSLGELKIGEFLQPLPQARIQWTRRGIRRYANFPGFAELANKMIAALNARPSDVKLSTYKV